MDNEIKLTEEQRKQIALEMKAVTRRIEEDIRILVGSLDDLGQKEISVLIGGWEIHMKRITEKQSN